MTNESYPEVRHNGRSYLVARPGGTFEIKIVASLTPPPCWVRVSDREQKYPYLNSFT